MSAINSPPSGAKFSNQKNRYTLSISDANEHDLPDVDGDDTAGGEGYRIGSAEAVNATIINNQDQSLTARLEAVGARDKGSFNEPNKLVEGVNVAAASGGTPGVQALKWSNDDDGSYAELRVVLSFDSNPSGNNDTVVEYRKSY